MISIWWSILLTIIAVGCCVALIYKKWWGFALGVFQQVLWLIYAVSTKQYGFLASAAIFGVLNVVGWRKWKAEQDGDLSTVS